MTARPQVMSPVILIGFMGSGKTTVGPLLADLLGCPFVDLDDLVEARAGKPIAAIFAEKGEPAFRALESSCLEQLLNAPRATGLVAALGGGAWLNPRNREIIAERTGRTVFLDCPVETLAERCAGLPHRPLARDPETFQRLYHERLPAYRQAEITVSTATSAPAACAQAIAKRLAARLS